jgi:rod shape-determining protein MreC
MDEDNQALRLRVDQLLSENARLREIVHENELLRQEIGFQYEHKYDTVPAAVIGHSADPAVQTIEINVGTTRGIANDMPVIISDGLLVGRVSQVGLTTAMVTLLSDRQSVISAVVQDTRATGIVRGRRGLELLMDSIPQTEDVETGQAVVTSGLGGDFPAGLMIGEIKEVHESDNELFKEARLTPAVVFDRLEIVFVLTETK